MASKGGIGRTMSQVLPRRTVPSRPRRSSLAIRGSLLTCVRIRVDGLVLCCRATPSSAPAAPPPAATTSTSAAAPTTTPTAPTVRLRGLFDDGGLDFDLFGGSNVVRVDDLLDPGGGLVLSVMRAVFAVESGRAASTASSTRPSAPPTSEAATATSSSSARCSSFGVGVHEKSGWY